MVEPDYTVDELAEEIEISDNPFEGEVADFPLPESYHALGKLKYIGEELRDTRAGVPKVVVTYETARGGDREEYWMVDTRRVPDEMLEAALAA